MLTRSIRVSQRAFRGSKIESWHLPVYPSSLAGQWRRSISVPAVLTLLLTFSIVVKAKCFCEAYLMELIRFCIHL